MHVSLTVHVANTCHRELDCRSDLYICAGFTELLLTEQRLDFRDANSITVANMGLDISSHGVHAAFPDGFCSVYLNSAP